MKLYILSFLCILLTVTSTYGLHGLPSRPTPVELTSSLPSPMSNSPPSRYTVKMDEKRKKREQPTPSPSTSPRVSIIPTYTIVSSPSTLPGLNEYSSPNHTLVISGAAAIGCIGLVLASACYFRHFKFVQVMDYSSKRNKRNKRIDKATVASFSPTVDQQSILLDNNKDDEEEISLSDMGSEYKKSLLDNEYTIITDYAKINEYELQQSKRSIATVEQNNASQYFPSSLTGFLRTSSVFQQYIPSSSIRKNLLPSYERTLSRSSTNSVQEEMNSILTTEYYPSNSSSSNHSPIVIVSTPPTTNTKGRESGGTMNNINSRNTSSIVSFDPSNNPSPAITP